VAIVICLPDGADWLIDTWLMSCRVLNRKLEETTLNCIVAAAKSAGVRSVIGQYLPTDRNDMVKEHYPRLGFERLGDGDGGTRWRLDVASYVAPCVPIEIVELEPAASGAAGDRGRIADSART
jgi:predicted enzyme involved in methoxymalonyl-ACP biosynthesis